MVGALKDFPTSIVRVLREKGFQAYLVGGCVRDLLLSRDPKDYDVATNATPQQVAALSEYVDGTALPILRWRPDRSVEPLEIAQSREWHADDDAG